MILATAFVGAFAGVLPAKRAAQLIQLKHCATSNLLAERCAPRCHGRTISPIDSRRYGSVACG